MRISTWTKWTHAPSPQKFVGSLWSYRFLKSHSSDCKKKKIFFHELYHVTYLSIGNFMLFSNHIRKIVWKSIFRSVSSNILFLPEIAILKVFVNYCSLLCMCRRCFYSCVCVLYSFYNRFPFYFSNLMYDFVIFDVWFFNS